MEIGSTLIGWIRPWDPIQREQCHSPTPYRLPSAGLGRQEKPVGIEGPSRIGRAETP
jgi:hypothetical protein